MRIVFGYHSTYGMWVKNSRPKSGGSSSLPQQSHSPGSITVSAHAGIVKMPQWIMIPNLASSNHAGSGWVASDSAVGAYGIAGGAVSKTPSPQSVRAASNARR